MTFKWLWPNDALKRHEIGHQATTWNNVEYPSVSSFGILPRAILLEMPKISILDMSLKIPNSELQMYLPVTAVRVVQGDCERLYLYHRREIGPNCAKYVPTKS